MSGSDPLFTTVAIWGVGLIGGSVGMAIRRAGLAREVVGIDLTPLDEAVALGAIDRYVTDPALVLGRADLLILAMPVGPMIELATVWGPQLRPGTLVTDVGSTKAGVVAAWSEQLADGAHFIGGHPMFGREQSGITAASEQMVTGCRWVLTPAAGSPPDALAAVRRLVEGLGAIPLVMSPAEHDRRAAGVSHLPQLVATALAAAALDLDRRHPGTLALAAGGFRDTTRIADSPAGLWSEIWLANADAVREAIVAFRQALADLEGAVEGGDPSAIAALFDQAHEARRRIMR